MKTCSEALLSEDQFLKVLEITYPPLPNALPDHLRWNLFYERGGRAVGTFLLFVNKIADFGHTLLHATELGSIWYDHNIDLIRILNLTFLKQCQGMVSVISVEIPHSIYVLANIYLERDQKLF